MTDSNVRLAHFGLNLVVEAVGAEVVEALRAAGLHSIVLKGPALVHWLYGFEEARSSIDVDVFVDPRTAGRAENVLRQLGFQPAVTTTGAADRPRHAHAWSRSLNEPAVDLHTTIVGVGVPPEVLWGVMRRHTETARMSGTEVDVPAPDVRLLQVALHAAQHGKREPQPLQDLTRALEIATRAEWERTATLARLLRAEEGFAAGLDLLEKGRLLRESLELTPTSSVETVLRATSPPPLAIGFDWLVRAPGVRARARFALGKTFPPPGFMRTWSTLARRGRTGLMVAYLWRPFWLLIHIGPAIRAWLLARKEPQP